MSETGDRAMLLRTALEAAVTGDQAVLDRVYAEDVAGWGPGMTVASRAELTDQLRGRKGAFSDIDLVLDPVEVIGEKVIAEWRLAAIHTGCAGVG